MDIEETMGIYTSRRPSSVFLHMLHLSKTKHENVYTLHKTLNPAIPFSSVRG